MKDPYYDSFKKGNRVGAKAIIVRAIPTLFLMGALTIGGCVYGRATATQPAPVVIQYENTVRQAETIIKNTPREEEQLNALVDSMWYLVDKDKRYELSKSGMEEFLVDKGSGIANTVKNGLASGLEALSDYLRTND
jgi:hypothetical protein